MWKHPNTLWMHVHLNLTGSELQNKGCLIVTYSDPRLSNAVQDYIIIIICTTNCNFSWFSMGKYTHTQCASGKHKLVGVRWSISLLSWQLSPLCIAHHHPLVPHSQAPPSFPSFEYKGESLGEAGGGWGSLGEHCRRPEAKKTEVEAFMATYLWFVQLQTFNSWLLTTV